jgi:hypothetical protein
VPAPVPSSEDNPNARAIRRTLISGGYGNPRGIGDDEVPASAGNVPVL